MSPADDGGLLDPGHLSQHLDRLYRAAWALCGSPHDAEDLVQETCARVLARPRVLGRRDALPWEHLPAWPWTPPA